MAAEKVKAGQEIRASQLNGVIDAISIGQPNGTTPFRNTTTGTLVNGGQAYTTKAPSSYDPLFNISYGSGTLDDKFDSETGKFNGIWIQLADWEQLELMLYHGTFFSDPVTLFLIDPTSDGEKLIWIVGTDGIPQTGKIPLCEAKKSGGLAVFQVFNSSSSAGSDAYNGSTCIILGDFTKFGADQGWRPNFGENAFDKYLSAIKSTPGAQRLFQGVDEICMRWSSPVYVQKSELADQQFSKPVSYTIGQQCIESIPDGNQNANSIGKDIYLSSIQLTPSTQFNTIGSPTWSYSLFNFHRKSTDLYQIELSDYAHYDILLRHKADHPHQTDITKNNCSAILEYANYGNLIGTVDSKIDPIHLSSIQEATWTYPGTNNNIRYHQLYDFDDGLLQEFEVSDSIDVVVRDYETTGGIGAKVNYIQLSSLAKKLGDVENDTEVIINQKSIERTTHRPPGQQQQVPLNQLYNFDDPTSINDRTFRVTLTYDGAPRYFRADGGDSSYSDTNNLLLSKHDAGNGNVLEYDNIVVVAPPINAYTDIPNLSDVISDIIIDNPISVDIASISAQLSDVFWIQGDRHNRTCWGASIGDSTKNKMIDLDAGTLNWGGQARVDWGIGVLKYFGGMTSVNWDGSTLNNINGEATVDWKNMHLINSLKKTTVDWENCELNDTQGNNSVKWEDREALNSTGSVTVDWEECYMADSAGVSSIYWEDRLLYDKAQLMSIDWDTRIMNDSTGHTTLKWGDGQLNVPGTGVTSLDWKDGVLYKPSTGALSLNWRVGYAKDPSGSGCTINWNTGQLWKDDNTRVLNWKLSQLIGNWLCNNGTFSCTGDLSCNGGVTMGSGHVLKIGNTTLSEQQLQQLLRLI